MLCIHKVREVQLFRVHLNLFQRRHILGLQEVATHAVQKNTLALQLMNITLLLMGVLCRRPTRGIHLSLDRVPRSGLLQGLQMVIIIQVEI